MRNIIKKGLAFSIIISSLITGFSGQNFEEVIQVASNDNFIYMDIPLDHEMQDFIYNQSVYMGVPYTLVLGIIHHESNFKADAISKTNDYGLMQINVINFPEIRQVFGFTDMLNPKDNVCAGIYLLSKLYTKYRGDIHKVLMAYNYGEGKAKAHWNLGIFESEYSKKVLIYYATYKRTSENSRRKS